jgi:CO dehydrogenase maturation factor
MKISMSGKGGSGKSTLVTLVALELRDRGYLPLVVDSDESNTVLYRMMGFAQPPVPLVTLAGGRQMVRELMPPKYAPGPHGPSTNVLARASISSADIPPENMREKDNLRLVVVGKIVQAMEGCACPMGVLGKEFLAKLNLSQKEIAIADMEAGVEHFGRGFEASIDCALIAVEPSFESVTLAGRVKYLASGSGVRNVGAILTKVPTSEIATRLKSQLEQEGVAVIGAVPFDQEIFNACLEGLPLSKGNTSKELKSISDYLLSLPG